MTRPEWLLALHCLASVEACAAAERGDGESFRWLVDVAGEALDQAGEDADWGAMRAWLEAREEDVAA